MFNLKLKEDGFWSKKELSYQFVHMFFSFWSGYILYLWTGQFATLFIGLIIGFAVEFIQHYKLTDEQLTRRRIIGSIFDYTFWVVGVILLLFAKSHPLIW